MLNAAIRTARSFTGRLADGDVEVVGDGLCPTGRARLRARQSCRLPPSPENVRFSGLKCSHDGRFVPSVFFAL